MLTLPDAILPVLHPFATLFRSPTWLKAQILLVGAILAPGQRTVAAALRVMGLSDDRNYARYHQVLNRAVWSPRRAAGILLGLLILHIGPGRWSVDLRHTSPVPIRKPWSGVAALKSNPWASTAMRCAPAGLRWSRPAACAGSP